MDSCPRPESERCLQLQPPLLTITITDTAPPAMTSLKRGLSASDNTVEQGPSVRRKTRYNVDDGPFALESYRWFKSSRGVVRAIMISVDIIADLRLTRSSVENNRELLEGAFESGDLDRVIESIEGLRSPQISPSSSGSHNQTAVRIPPPAVQVEAVKKAWIADYTTDYHEALFRVIDQTDKERHYSNHVPIVNSSGTGKSRLVHELARIAFTFPFNLRRDDDYGSFSYPKPDSQVRDFLTTQSNSDEDSACNYLKFFICLFNNARQHLLDDRFCSQRSLRDLAFTWREYLDDETRTNLYKKSLADIDTTFTTEKHHDGSIQPAVTRRELERMVVSAITDLQGVIVRRDVNDTEIPMMILYFDEASDIAQTRGKHKTLYEVLLGCINALRQRNVFGITLSTQSHMYELAPIQSQFASSRAQRDKGKPLSPPITELPFDCGPGIPVAASSLTFDKITNVAFMAQLGRPLFWALQSNSLAGDPDSYAFPNNLIRFARRKLLCSMDIDNAARDFSTESLLALIDILLRLHFKPQQHMICRIQQESIPTEETLINSHMRYVHSVPEHRIYSYSTYPSEPILAEAAAQQLHAFSTHQLRPSSLIDVLDKHVENGLIDIGERGEVVARLLIIRAAMRAVEVECKEGDQLWYSKGNKTFEDALGNMTMRLTHFEKLKDGSGLSQEGAQAAFTRGCGYICEGMQEGVDLMIPIADITNGDEVLSLSKFTFLLFQFNNCGNRPAVNRVIIDTAQLGLFNAQPSSAPIPYAALMIELGIPSDSKHYGEIHTPTCARSSSRHNDIHPYPRYAVFAYGCSNKIYKVVQTSEECEFSFLLGSRELSEHPRKETFQAVLKTRPFVTADQGYSYIKQCEETGR
ncbi:hypothetical protein ABKN59_005644 [Abortiporus biennis]